MKFIELRENVASNLMRSADKLKSESKKRVRIEATAIPLSILPLPLLGAIDLATEMVGMPNQWIVPGQLILLMTLSGEIGNFVGRMSDGRKTIQTSSFFGPHLSRGMDRFAKVIKPKR